MDRLERRADGPIRTEAPNLSKLQYELVAYRPEYALEAVKLWRRSFQRAMGLEEQNRLGEVRGQLDYLSV